MKKLLIVLTILLAGATTAGAYNVSTEVQKKNILIEDFSGVRCGNCPDAADILHKMQRNHDNIYSITIHAGSYAEPLADNKDFRTDDGNTIRDHFAPDAYPKGMVNRSSINGGYVKGRDTWVALSKMYEVKNSIVNLYATAEGDASTREVTIHVEGYYTGEPENATNYLCVAMLQDNMLSYQIDNYAYDGYGGVVENYNQMHVLRDYVSDVWGDPISAAKGSYFEKDYTYKVPASIKNLSCDLKNINFMIYVLGAEKTDVLKTVNVVPTFDGLTFPLAFKVEKPRIPVGEIYGFDFFEVNLYNQSNVNVTEMYFEVTVNGETYECPWHGALAPRSNADVRIDMPADFKWAESNSFSIKAKKANGKDVASSSTLSGSFFAPKVVAGSEVTWVVNTDYYASDNAFTIRDKDGKVVEELGPFEEGYAKEYSGSLTLEDGTYCLEATDKWGDGISKPGTIGILDKEGKEVGVNRVFDLGERVFFTVDHSAGVNSIEADDNAPKEYFNLNGMRVDKNSLVPGLYIIKQGSKATKNIVK